jgi:multiple sugar transport system substrate-binding protein
MNPTISRRGLLQLAGLGAGTAAVAACTPSAPGPSTGGGAATSGGAPTNFRLASWTLADDISKVGVQNLMKSFEASTKVTITPTAIAYNEYLNQLILQVRGGQFTGAVQLDIAWLSQLAALGKLRDLADKAKGAGYTDAALKTGQLEGKQYGLPWTTGAIGLIVNQKILDQVGAKEVPATIDQFEALLTELKGKGVVPYAASTKVAQLKDIVVWMQTFGSPIVENGKVVIGDDASVEAVNWYKKLYDQKLIAPDVERADARALFAQGKTAMYDDAIVGKDVVAKQASDKSLKDSIAPAARPVTKTGDSPRALAWGHIAVVVEGEGADTAADFAKFATSDKTAVLGYFKDVSLPPTTTEALADPAVTSDKFTTAFTEKITKTATPNPLWPFPQYGQMEAILSKSVQAVLVGQASAKDALTKAREDMSKLG